MTDGRGADGPDCGQIETLAFRQRLRNGTEVAWTTLVQRLQHLLEGVARAVGARGPQIEDAVNETWLRAYRNRRKLDPSRPIKPWLATICRNICRDDFRKHRPDLLGEMQPDGEAPPSSQASDPWKHLDKLPSSEREALLLHFCFGLTPAEIAELFGVSVNAIYQRLRRGIQRLGEDGELNDED